MIKSIWCRQIDHRNHYHWIIVFRFLKYRKSEIDLANSNMITLSEVYSCQPFRDPERFPWASIIGSVSKKDVAPIMSSIVC